MIRSAAQQQLGNRLMAATPAPRHPALLHLIEALREKHGDCVAAVLYYGSCLRSGNPYEGLVDLYLIVDNYRCANASRLAALWNWLLPPNVFYAEFTHADQTLRCKYAILSLDDLRRGTSGRWFHSYLWGRFSQPTALAWCRNTEVREQVANSLAQALLTFLDRVLPALPEQGSAQSLWSGGLKLSYRAELRAESGGRSAELTAANLAFYEQVTAEAVPLLHWPVTLAGVTGQLTYTSRIGKFARLRNRLGWTLRIAQGKLLSLARLLKALFTFEGGLDYIAWKLERHSGVPVDIPDKVRRYPLIFIWGLFWRLYRRGIFR